MLREITNVRQIPEEGTRRWFRDENFDLIVWYEPDNPNQMHGFQLCYDAQGSERAVTWRRTSGYQHHRIDTGEEPFSPKRTPILIEDGHFSPGSVLSSFRKAAKEIDPDITAAVSGILADYPEASS
ncbi:MAG: hypothetical protein ACOCVC_05770 [Spirochaeta sp.]